MKRNELHLREDIRMARFKQRDATIRWFFMSFVIGFAFTHSMLNTVLIAVIGSLVGYLLYGMEVRDLEDMQRLGGKK